MREQDVQRLMKMEEYEVPRPMVLTTRTFKRSITHGAVVRRSTTRNFDCEYEIEHIEMTCPHLKWTDCGPVWHRNVEEE
jgi:hypothetical protein